MEKGDHVQIKAKWDNAGRRGIVLGDPVGDDGQLWIPVKWDGEEDPDFHKAAGLLPLLKAPKADAPVLLARYVHSGAHWHLAAPVAADVTLYGLSAGSKGPHIAIPSRFLPDMNDHDLAEYIRDSGILESDH